MRTSNLLIVCLAAAILLAIPGVAGAHASLDHAEPAVGSTVKTSPSNIAVYFSTAVESAGSSLDVLDSVGKRVDKNDMKVDSKDATRMTISVPLLPEGTYTVEWKATSADTHHTHGSFTFTVKATG